VGARRQPAPSGGQPVALASSLGCRASAMAFACLDHGAIGPPGIPDPSRLSYLAKGCGEALHERDLACPRPW